MGAVLIGSGKALPKLTLPNTDLEDLVITNDEWIRTRTGIHARHIGISETTIDLACAASLGALGRVDQVEGLEDVQGWSADKVALDSIDLVVFATITPDTIVPSSASALKARLGLDNAIAFDINAACTGFIYAVSVAEAMMSASSVQTAGHGGRNHIKRALIVCSERLSRLTNWQDRNTCVLFGDGAGAALLEWDEEKPGILATFMANADDADYSLSCPHSYEPLFPFTAEGVICDTPAFEAHHESHPDPKAVDYSYINALDIPADPAACVTDELLGITEKLEAGSPRQVISMDGQKIFKFAGRALANAIEEVLDRSGLALDDIKIIVPHQANERIIRFAAKRLDLPLERFQLSISDVGNTSSASVVMALSDALESKSINPGDKVILVAFGGGLTYGAILFEL